MSYCKIHEYERYTLLTIVRENVQLTAKLPHDGSVRRCPSYPGYSAASDGRIISHHRRLRGERVVDYGHARVLTPTVGTGGYMIVTTSSLGVSKTTHVHRLVADAFHGAAPKSSQVRHLDGSRTNNCANNLRHGTAKENADDRRRHGTQPMGEDVCNAKLTVDQVMELRRRYANGEHCHVLAAEFGVSKTTANFAVVGRTWKHLPVLHERPPSFTAVASEKGVSVRAAWMRVRRGMTKEQALSAPSMVPVGSNKAQAKLTESTVVLLRRRRSEGATFATLSVEFGVSISTASLAARRVTWRHVP